MTYRNLRIMPVAENFLRVVSRQSSTAFKYSRRVIFLVDSTSRKNVKAAEKFHLRRPASQQDLEAALFIRPQENDRGSEANTSHEQERLLSRDIP
jgi:hypothetical protein